MIGYIYIYIKWKGYNNSFSSWFDKKVTLYKISYYSELYSHSKNVKVELDLANYATKFDLKHAVGVDTSEFAKKTDLASLESDIDKLGIGKLETTPAD